MKNFQLYNCPECGDISIVENKPFRRICSLEPCHGVLVLVEEFESLKDIGKPLYGKRTSAGKRTQRGVDSATRQQEI